jgi:hypothetical protein
MSVVGAVPATALTMGLYMGLYKQLGSLFPITSTEGHDLFSLEGNIGRLGVVGVTTAAVLAGYGGVTTPYMWMACCHSRTTSVDVLAKGQIVKRAQDNAVRRIRARRRAVLEAGGALGGGSSVLGPLMDTKTPGFILDCDSHVASLLERRAVSPAQARAEVSGRDALGGYGRETVARGGGEEAKRVSSWNPLSMVWSWIEEVTMSEGVALPLTRARDARSMEQMAIAVLKHETRTHLELEQAYRQSQSRMTWVGWVLGWAGVFLAGYSTIRMLTVSF